MRKVTLAAGVIALGAISSIPAWAVPDPALPKIVLHIAGVTTKGQCTTNFTNTAPNCLSTRTNGSLYPTLYFVYVATYFPNVPTTAGVTGLQFGLQYQGGATGGALDAMGIDFYSWSLCATLEFQQPMPVWPNPGCGTAITWAACQTTNQLSQAGYFYTAAYPEGLGDGLLKLTVRPVDMASKVTDCSATEIGVPTGLLGTAQFSASGTTEGCNPCIVDSCDPTPIEETTWGSIKSLYSR